MQVVFQNPYLLMQFDAERDFMETVWTTKASMGEETYKELMFSYLRQLQQHRPRRLLIDSRRAEYMLTPEIQDWINTHIYPPTAEAGIKKLAFLLGEDFFMNLSLEMVAEESEQTPLVHDQMEQRFFISYDSAVKWLMR